MKLTIVATVLLGLLLTPALSFYLPSKGGNQQILNNPTVIRKQFHVGEVYETVTINREMFVATVEERSPRWSWKSVWDYNSGYIATKVLSEGTCYISRMNRREVPNFETLPLLADEARLMGQGLPEKQVTFVIRERIYNLQPFGQEIFNMCNGLNTYMANEVRGPAYTSALERCLRLNILQLVNLNYCRADLVPNFNPSYNHGYNPGYNPGFNPNFNPNLNPNNPNLIPNNPNFNPNLNPNNPNFNPNNPNNQNFNPNLKI